MTTITKVSYVTVTYDEAGQRLDNFLLSRYKGVPKSRIYKAVRKGEVRVDSARVDAKRKLNANEIVRLPPIRVKDEQEINSSHASLLAEKLQHNIIYDNPEILVVNKPAGHPVHGGSGCEVGVIEAARLLYPNASKLNLGHRLDRFTSGCLALFKSRNSLLIFHEALKKRNVVKTYRCIVAGKWPSDIDVIDAPLLAKDGGRTAIGEEGKDAVTKVEVISQNKRFSLLEVNILTGRTHQIRAHLSSYGYPIIGDGKYGWKRANYPDLKGNIRIMLHSYQLSFPWKNSKELKFKAKMPEDFIKCLSILENTSA